EGLTRSAGEGPRRPGGLCDGLLPGEGRVEVVHGSDVDVLDAPVVDGGVVEPEARRGGLLAEDLVVRVDALADQVAAGVVDGVREDRGAHAKRLPHVVDLAVRMIAVPHG